MNKYIKPVYNGIIKENPTFVLMLGMCPTLAVTTSAMSGMGMGLTTMAVLIMSNFVISALRKIIPERVRIPAYIVIVATLVTVVQLLLQANLPSLYDTLGIYIPLIVVNCIILGRAEAFAMKYPPHLAIVDALGNAMGYGLVLLSVAFVRELFASGNLFGHSVFTTIENGGWYLPNEMFKLPPSAFFLIGALIWTINVIQRKRG